MNNYYERIMYKIEHCIRDIDTTKKQKLERLKDILEVTTNLFETGRINTAEYNTIFITITENMWECI